MTFLAWWQQMAIFSANREIRRLIDFSYSGHDRDNLSRSAMLQEKPPVYSVLFFTSRCKKNHNPFSHLIGTISHSRLWQIKTRAYHSACLRIGADTSLHCSSIVRDLTLVRNWPWQCRLEFNCSLLSLEGLWSSLSFTAFSWCFALLVSMCCSPRGVPLGSLPRDLWIRRCSWSAPFSSCL